MGGGGGGEGGGGAGLTGLHISKHKEQPQA